jgi:hypothetical protein
VLGNQGYDAVVKDSLGREVDRIEITVPHDGAATATDAKLLVTRGFGRAMVGKPRDDFDDLIPLVLGTCEAKALKDYSGYTLLVAIEPMTPFAGLEQLYEQQLENLTRSMAAIQYRARRVCLLVLPSRLMTIWASDTHIAK